MTRASVPLGQHWLHDRAYLDQIVDMADIKPGENVLEVGPGPGTLTRELLAAGATVVAVELDAALAEALQANLNTPKLRVIQSDILSFNLEQLPRRYKVVANIPYYLTAQLIRTLLESTNPPASMTLLVQKEVAERLAAKPGELSILGIAAQLYADIKLGTVVPASAFQPPPKVESQVIQLIHLPQPKIDVEPAAFFRLVKAGFSAKRKMLDNALAGSLHLSKIDANELLQAVDISASKRAQNLNLLEWKKLYDQAKKRGVI